MSFINRKINDYVIVGTLGKGAYGTVFQVQSVDKKKYAMKVILVKTQDKSSALNQGQAYIQLKHPSIIKARQFFFIQEQKYLAIVLQLCPEGDLSCKIGKLQLDQSHSIMKQITEGLIYLHKEKKIIHRDLKPENILIHNGHPKISDLGLAKIVDSSGQSSKAGAQNYMAPETFRQGLYCFQSDVYSLGLLFLQLLTGQRVKSLMKKSRMPPALQDNFFSQEVRKQIVQEIYIPLLQEMLKKDPQQRIRTQKVLKTLNNINIERKFKSKIKDNREKVQQMCPDELIELLQKDIYFPNLRHIVELTQNQIQDKGFIKLIQNAHKFPYLSELYLPRNKITCNGLQLMAINGENFNALVLLCLSQNKITDQGFIALTQNAEKFINLQILLLSDNLITDFGFRQFAVKGQKFKKLKQFYLASNMITDKGLKDFISKGRNFPKLCKIDLDRNKISSEGIQLLMKNKTNFDNLQLAYLGDENSIRSKSLIMLSS